MEAPTVAEVIEFLQRQPPAAKVILSDPDTGWAMAPTFEAVDDNNEVFITAEYYEAL